MKQIHTYFCTGFSRTALILSLGTALVLLGATPGFGQTILRQLSQDTFSGGNGQHQTESFLYVESFGNPRKFVGTARRVAQRMPVLTVIGGRSPAGQRAAASHHAAAATPLATQEALFGRAGVIATTSLG